jgi:type IX secretion system PorP/SprF family membrane protein
MKSYNIFKLILFIFFIVNNINAQQEANFTLYNFNMNIINPAYAGINEISKLNFVHRYQYLGIDDSPRTTSLIYSKSVGKNLGIGVSMLNDRVFILSQTDLALDISYKLQLNENTNLYFGMKFGGGFVNIDLTKAHNSYYDPLFNKNQSFFNPHIGSGISLQSEKFYISFSSPNFLRGQRFEKS